MPLATPHWGIRIVRYVGNGAAGRVLSTPFDFSAGNRIVFIYPHGGVDDNASCRTSASTSTYIDGGTSRLTPAQGIDFVAGGIKLGLGGGIGGSSLNGVNRGYVAIILRDSTGYTMVRTYAGNGVNNRVIDDGFGTALGALIVLGRSWTYRDTSFGFDSSMPLNNDASAILSNTIKEFGVNDGGVPPIIGFQVGTNNNVNAGAISDYLSIAFSTTALADMVDGGLIPFSAVGTGAILSIGGFGLQPTWAIARRLATGSAAADRWRALCAQTGTASQISGGAVDGANGIRSLDADGLTVGTGISQAGIDIHGFTWGNNDAGIVCATPPLPEDGETLFVYNGFAGGFTSYDTFPHGPDSGGGVGCDDTLPQGSDSGGGTGCAVTF